MFGKHVETMAAHLKAAADSRQQVVAAQKSDNAGLRALATATTRLAQQVDVMAQQQAAQAEKADMVIALAASFAGAVVSLGPRSVGGFPGGLVGSGSAAAAQTPAVATLMSKLTELFAAPASLQPAPVENAAAALAGSLALPGGASSSYVPRNLGSFDSEGGVFAFWYAPVDAFLRCKPLLRSALVHIDHGTRSLHLDRNEYKQSMIFLTDHKTAEGKRWRTWLKARILASACPPGP